MRCILKKLCTTPRGPMATRWELLKQLLDSIDTVRCKIRQWGAYPCEGKLREPLSMGRGWLLAGLSLFATLLTYAANSQQGVWQPAAGHVQVPIWPGSAPDARPMDGPEIAQLTGPKDLVAGKPWLAVERVSRPTLTVYSPNGKNTGAAVIVFPGGGYEILAIDLEGSEVCDWLVVKGITCVLLKYRVPAPRSAPYWGAYPQSPIALEDAQRTIGLVRLHAPEWHIDPHKVGVLGFSAGGHLVAATSVHFDKRTRRIDKAVVQTSRWPSTRVIFR